MVKFSVDVTFTMDVELDESKFTPEFMADFQHSMYHFTELESHAAHLAQLHAREIFDPKFIEGYGPAADFGIKIINVDQREDVYQMQDSAS